MSERISKRDVAAAFAYLKKAAESAGIKGSEDWTLHAGNSSYGYQWFISSKSGFKKGRNLGTTKREAREALLHMAEGIWLVNKE
jgi:hypothetical protein